jgi:uncharacterized membrane protein
MHILILGLFFVGYLLLSIVRHAHGGSFGFDLGIADQTVWAYSNFYPPITTIDHIPFISELFVHLEFIYIFLAPFYWIYSSVYTLLFLQVCAVILSAIPIVLLCRFHRLSQTILLILLVSYLMFYGLQQAVWFDVHSTVFGMCALSWFIYWLETKKMRLAIIAFILANISKENYAAMTGLVSMIYVIRYRDVRYAWFTLASFCYAIFVFGVYFPYIVPGGYRFASESGLFSGMTFVDLWNTPEKRQVWFVTLGWTGFLSLFSPIMLLPLVGNLASYFILGREVTTAQGLFLQYRSELAPLLFLATLYGLLKIPRSWRTIATIWVLICTLYFQYSLHLPLSYLSKGYFWETPHTMQSVRRVIAKIKPEDSIVAQNNLVPHLSQRKEIFSLWHEKKDFLQDSPCGLVSLGRETVISSGGYCQGLGYPTFFSRSRIFYWCY